MSRLLGLVGKDLRHSFSPDFFRQKFEREQITDAEYRLFPFDNPEDIVQLRNLATLSGFNVTIPYKSAIIPYLDEIDVEAQVIGAVNTVVVNAGRWIGYNTDVLGFADTLSLLATNRPRTALVLGTGGASKAVIHVLKKRGFRILQVSRQGGDDLLTYEDVDAAIISQVALIINTTPLGTWPNVSELPVIPYHAVTQAHILIDLVYNPPETAFLKAGRQQGAIGINGHAMLIAQAEASWKLWQSNY